MVVVMEVHTPQQIPHYIPLVVEVLEVIQALVVMVVLVVHLTQVM
jgi:hypothetical protein